jgi:glucan 1,3-beta-glucosidase
MSDLYFFYGAIGIRCKCVPPRLSFHTHESLGGNQQFTTRNFFFFEPVIAIDMLWDWGWTWKSIYTYGVDIAIQITGNFLGGSIYVLDSQFSNTAIGIYVSTPSGDTTAEHFSINIDNLILDSVYAAVYDSTTGAVLVGGSQTIETWTSGRYYDDNHPNGALAAGSLAAHPKTESLRGGPNSGYFERSKPQYEDLSSSDFLSAKIIAQGIFIRILHYPRTNIYR